MKAKLFYWFVWIAVLAIIPGCENEDQLPYVDDTGLIIGGDNVNQAVVSTTVDGITVSFWLQGKDGVRKTVFESDEPIGFGYSFENGGTIDTLRVNFRQSNINDFGYVRNSKGELLKSETLYDFRLDLYHFEIGKKLENVVYHWNSVDFLTPLYPDSYETTLKPTLEFYRRRIAMESTYMGYMRFPPLTLKFEIR